MNKDIFYQTRLYGNDSIKITGGVFGGSIDLETIERLTKNHFKVVIKNSGHAVFVNNKNQEVNLYIKVDPNITTIGKEAKLKYLEEKKKNLIKEQEQEDTKRALIEELMDTMSLEEILQKLKK